MTDLSALSDNDLKAMYAGAAAPSPSPLASLSDDQLKALHQSVSGPDVATDIAKSAAIGVPKGVIGLAGVPGDLSELGARGLDWATRKVGSAFGADIPERPDQPFRGGTADIQRGVESITGPLYEPQTTAGQYAQTAGEFVPAMVGGPEALVTKVLTRVAAPALASEGAGQMAKGSALEPVARVAGAVLGSALGHKLMTPAAAADAVPSVDQLKQAARTGYQHPDVQAVEIKPAALSAHADDVATELNRQGFRPIGAPQTYSLVDELKSVPGQTATIADIDSVRSALGKVGRQVDATGRPTVDAVAAGKATGQIDNFLTNLKQPDLVAGDAAKASDILAEARGNWGAAKRAEDLGVRLTRADRQAAKAGSGSNIDNAIRQKVSAVLDVPSRSASYSPDELAAAEQVVRGTPTGNALRKVGKLGVGDGLSLLLHAGMALPTGGMSIPVAIAGTIARKMSEGMTQANAARLEQMLRSRSPEAQQWQSMAARVAAAQPRPSLIGQGTTSGVLASVPFSLAPSIQTRP